MGSFFSSPQQTTLQPTPVEKVPGLQNLGQNLVQYFQNLLTGNLRQMPYQGYQSVYGGPGGSFPGIYSTQTGANDMLGNLLSPGGQGMQTLTNAIQQAIMQAQPQMSATQGNLGPIIGGRAQGVASQQL
jgi:hypothetical protein